MQTHFILLLLISVFALTISSCTEPKDPPPPNVTRVFDVDAPLITEYSVTLTKNETIRFEAIAKNGAPVLRLFNKDGTEVQNAAGTTEANRRIIFTPPETTTYTLLVHAVTEEDSGTCDILKNGRKWKFDVNFDAKELLLEDLRESEEIETVVLPNSGGPNHVAYIEDETGLFKRIEGDGLAGALHYVVPRNLGTVRILIGMSSFLPGKIRLLRNDVNFYDQDGDGLGNSLERDLGTCSNLYESAFDYGCWNSADPRDTDGDGIPDGWEVLGRRDKPAQPLALWGADPRHKDIFIEADFMRRTEAENSSRRIEHMDVGAMKIFRDVFTDSFTKDLQERAQNTISINNPDNKPGINPHFDAGFAAEEAKDVTLYGDWGGFNAVNAIATTDASGRTVYQGQSPSNASSENMAYSRLGIFRYLLFYTTGGASQGFGWQLALNGHSGYVLTHETGHSLGLGHSGPLHEKLAADVNCKPNYPSIMNYAFLHSGLSSGWPAIKLNNASLQETGFLSSFPASQTATFRKILRDDFKFLVDDSTGSVDWNRDGLFEAADKRVRAYANFKPYSDCEFTRYNQQRISTARSARSPALVRLDSILYAFFSSMNGEAAFAVSTSDWNCPAPGATCNNGFWSHPISINTNTYQGIDATKIQIDNKDKILVVSNDLNGNLWQTAVSDPMTISQKIPIPLEDGVLARGEPSITQNNNVVYLGFKDQNDRFILKRGNVIGQQIIWEPLIVATRPIYGAVTESLFVDHAASPLIAYDYFPGITTKSLWALIPRPNRSLSVYFFEETSKTWKLQDCAYLSHDFNRLYGRPSYAWVPFGETDLPGRLYLSFIKRSDDTSDPTPAEIRVLMSYQTSEPRIGLDSPFDNSWAYAYGIDLFYEHGIDSNLRALVANAIDVSDTRNELLFKPKADGINDFEYGNSNDWFTLSYGVCRSLSTSARVRCM